MDIKDDLMRILVQYRDRQHGGNSAEAAAALGVSPPTLWRWLNGKSLPKIETLLPVFQALGARIHVPGEVVERPATEDSALKEHLAKLRKELKESAHHKSMLEGQVALLKDQLKEAQTQIRDLERQLGNAQIAAQPQPQRVALKRDAEKVTQIL